jgi:hypothetical protein
VRQHDPDVSTGRPPQRQDKEYHLYLTNLDREEYRPPDIAQQDRARGEVEFLFNGLKSRFGVDEINTTDAYTLRL